MNREDALATARELQLMHGDRLDVVFHGLSMDPLLFEGDMVIVEPVDPDAIEIGDIVTYRHLDRYPTRRVVRIEPGRLTLWCDAWPTKVFHCRPDEVLGRAVARVRNGHRLDADSAEWTMRRDRAIRAHRRSSVLRAAVTARRHVGALRNRLATHET